jgi:hypothetical protein
MSSAPIKITIDQSQLKSLPRDIADKIFAQALSHSINRAVSAIKKPVGAKVKAAIPGALYRHIFGDSGSLKFSLVTIKKATVREPVAFMRLREPQGGVPARLFKPKKIVVDTARGKRTGTQIKLRGRYERLERAFMWSNEIRGAGKTVVIERKGDARYPLTASRVAFDRIFQSVEGFFDEFKEPAAAALAKNLNIDMEYYAKRMAKQVARTSGSSA